MEKAKILIVDDDVDIQDLLSYNFINRGYHVRVASSGKEALKLLNEKFDLLILDIMMPEMNGYILCQHIRRSNTDNKNTPIIFLTAKDTEEDELFGFEMGADDFITKPISMQKLFARVKANIKRAKFDNNLSNNICWGELYIDQTGRSVRINSNLIKLTKTEFNLLLLLISKEGKVFSRDELLNNIQDNNTIVTDRVIDVHIKKIRDKLSKYGSIIETVHGVGYLARKDNIPANI